MIQEEFSPNSGENVSNLIYVEELSPDLLKRFGK